MNQGGMQFQKVEETNIDGYNVRFSGMIFPIAKQNSSTKVLIVIPFSGHQGNSPRHLVSYTAVLTVEP
jgi:hypothetical protein